MGIGQDCVGHGWVVTARYEGINTAIGHGMGIGQDHEGLGLVVTTWYGYQSGMCRAWPGSDHTVWVSVRNV